ncbi:hypothetical protein [Archangium primigenium]|uniref:hypothetical protein n=1 Tax=[Archangium] primigenium TaxID=2792470 RepID=UPI00195F21DA|nr:hypothetical protein [Archangium primigenium]
MWRLHASLVLLLLAGCPRGTRLDDAFEPNDDASQATPLTPGTPIEARANQGNPDVFALEAPEARTLVFRMESLGQDNCPAFTVNGPDGGLLYEDRHRFCSRGPDEAWKAPGVELLLLDVRGYQIGTYELRVPTARAGRYLLTILEQGRVDNTVPFSWDYRLTARVE